MKRNLFIITMLFVLIVLSGCSPKAHYNETPIALSPEAQMYYEEMGITEDVRKEAVPVYNTCALRDGKKVQIRLPEYWDDIYVISNDEGVITVSEKYNYEKNEIGDLWCIMALTHEEFPQHFYVEGDAYAHVLGANSAVIGEDDTYVYVMSCPTDVQFDYEDEKAAVLYEAARDTRDQFINDFLEINEITVNEKAPVLN